jgi:hypothetical protein
MSNHIRAVSSNICKVVIYPLHTTLSTLPIDEERGSKMEMFCLDIVEDVAVPSNATVGSN